MNHQHQELLHPRWKEYNLLSQHKWTDATLITVAVWSLRKAGPAKNPTQTPQRGTLRSVFGEVLSLVLAVLSGMQRYVQAHSP